MFFSKKNTAPKFQWNYIHSIETFNFLLEKSSEKPLVIFKHSTRCPISTMALDRFSEMALDIAAESNLVMIDVIADRNISLYVAEHLGVTHQSPQVLIVQNKKAIFDNSHNGINGKEVFNILQTKKG